jgi:hypothetical protein
MRAEKDDQAKYFERKTHFKHPLCGEFPSLFS